MAYINPYYNPNRFNYQSSTEQGMSGNPSVKSLSGNNFVSDMGGTSAVNQPQSSDIVSSDFSGNSSSNGYSKAGAGLAIAESGIETFNKEQSNVDNFNINNTAGLEGGAKGAVTGLEAGGPWGALVGAIIGTVAGSFGTVSGVNNKVKKLDTSVNATSYDSMGNPIYNGQAISNADANANALTAGIHKNYQTSDITGTRWIAEAVYGTRKKMRRKRSELERNAAQARTTYNTAATNANKNYIAQQDYYNSLNNNNRLYNLYNTNI